MGAHHVEMSRVAEITQAIDDEIAFEYEYQRQRKRRKVMSDTPETRKKRGKRKVQGGRGGGDAQVGALASAATEATVLPALPPHRRWTMAYALSASPHASRESQEWLVVLQEALCGAWRRAEDAEKRVVKVQTQAGECQRKLREADDQAFRAFARWRSASGVLKGVVEGGEAGAGLVLVPAPWLWAC